MATDQCYTYHVNYVNLDTELYTSYNANQLTKSSNDMLSHPCLMIYVVDALHDCHKLQGNQNCLIGNLGLGAESVAIAD